MHVSFISYGERSCVERMLRDMEAQKHLMPMTKGKQKRGAWIPGAVRELPFGVKEYVFAKESLDMVLRTMNAVESYEGVHGINFKAMAYPVLRKILKLKPVPKYDEKGEIYLWGKSFVSIIVLGIREDGEIVGSYVDDKGWTHEAL
ncbi:hypothetical protein LCGC14_1204240 [marine sediment metagenome]|uniref:Uncharacterized protein n=1 Tax=marine sediment metagenome TaxID=412755 RepID=A0A0F9LG05_9ZZZZ